MSCATALEIKSVLDQLDECPAWSIYINKVAEIVHKLGGQLSLFGGALRRCFEYTSHPSNSDLDVWICGIEYSSFIKILETLNLDLVYHPIAKKVHFGGYAKIGGVNYGNMHIFSSTLYGQPIDFVWHAENYGPGTLDFVANGLELVYTPSLPWKWNLKEVLMGEERGYTVRNSINECRTKITTMIPLDNNVSPAVRRHRANRYKKMESMGYFEKGDPRAWYEEYSNKEHSLSYYGRQNGRGLLAYCDDSGNDDIDEFSSEEEE